MHAHGQLSMHGQVVSKPSSPHCPMATLRPRAVSIGGEAHHLEEGPGEEATETLEAICTGN